MTRNPNLLDALALLALLASAGPTVTGFVLKAEPGKAGATHDH